MNKSRELDELWMSDQKEISAAEFEPSVVNSLSILEGKNAQLDCTVKNLGSHEVSWYHIDKQLLLTIDGKTKSSNKRINIRNRGNSYTLFLEAVTLDDAGYYACRVGHNLCIK